MDRSDREHVGLGRDGLDLDPHVRATARREGQVAKGQVVQHLQRLKTVLPSLPEGEKHLVIAFGMKWRDVMIPKGRPELARAVSEVTANEQCSLPAPRARGAASSEVPREVAATPEEPGSLASSSSSSSTQPVTDASPVEASLVASSHERHAPGLVCSTGVREQHGANLPEKEPCPLSATPCSKPHHTELSQDQVAWDRSGDTMPSLVHDCEVALELRHAPRPREQAAPELECSIGADLRRSPPSPEINVVCSRSLVREESLASVPVPTSAACDSVDLPLHEHGGLMDQAMVDATLRELHSLAGLLQQSPIDNASQLATDDAMMEATEVTPHHAVPALKRSAPESPAADVTPASMDVDEAVWRLHELAPMSYRRQSRVIHL